MHGCCVYRVWWLGSINTHVYHNQYFKVALAILHVHKFIGGVFKHISPFSSCTFSPNTQHSICRMCAVLCFCVCVCVCVSVER